MGGGGIGEKEIRLVQECLVGGWGDGEGGEDTKRYGVGEGCQGGQVSAGKGVLEA